MAEINKLQLFLELSSGLTGIEVTSFDRPRAPAKSGDLAPRNGPVQLGPVYLALLEGWDEGRGIAKVLNEFNRRERTPASLQAMLDDAELGPICMSITKLWLLGVWYRPDQPEQPSHVVSVEAYIESLGPKIMQAHPMGYSMQYYGHWSNPPPPLSEFITLKK